MWGPFHKAMGEELDFSLKLAHYEDDNDEGKSARRLKPRGQELFNLIRHKAGQISKAKIHLDVRPVDDQYDPDTADVAKHAMEWELFHPQKGYEDKRDRMVMGALSARMWAIGADFNPALGPFGEIVFRNIDGRDLMWAPGFDSPHDPECPWVIEQFRMRVEDGKNKKGWRNKESLFGDDGTFSKGPTGGDASLRPGQTRLAGGNNAPELQGSGETEYFTGIRLWERNIKETEAREEAYRDLDPEEQYMQCGSADGGGCGWRSDTMEQLKLDELPEVHPGMCPECGSDAYRVDAVAVEDQVLIYPNGKLTIAAPLSGVILHIGDWPYELRTVPVCVFRSYIHPVDPMGQSDTRLNWTMQIAADVTLRLGLEHMMLSKPYQVMPEGAKDYLGEPWEARDDQGLMIYMGTDAMGQTPHLLQGNGLPPAWNTLHQAIQGVFKANMGTSDMGMTPTQTRDIPVGTIQALIQTGEIPVDHHIEQLRRAESPFFGALFDMIRATYSTARMVRFQNDNKQWDVLTLRGADLPNFDIVVTASPEQSRLAKEEIEALQIFAQTPAPYREFIAKRLNIPISDVRKIEEAEALEQQKQMQMQMAAGAAMPGQGSPPAPNGLPPAMTQAA